jgi:thiosulfate/3-mercaptopyruvate sulfurtransferase
MASFFTLFASDALVTAEWLNNNIDNKALKIIEISEPKAYDAGHIPGALNTSIGKWRVNNGTYLTVRSPKEIESEIRRLGIDNNSHVVLYAPVATPKDFLKTSYVYWALHYHGIKNVSLLDGAQMAWTAAGHALSAEPVTSAPSTFNVTVDASRVADLEYVKKSIGKLPMIDARPGDKYLGITPTPTVKRDGHIKGAMSYSWNYSVDADYTLKPAQQLGDLFTNGYGLSKDQEIIVYCTGGLETSFNYFVLSGVLGYKNIRLYDASMKEWGNREETPMTQYNYESFVR